MDIIVTTPKSEMVNAQREAADCLKAGSGQYFRVFRRSGSFPVFVGVGSRVYYVEDGFIRGFAIVASLGRGMRDTWGRREGFTCATTGRFYPCDSGGGVVFMNADSWQWIEPVPMKGFQNFRYPTFGRHSVKIVGGWRDPKPQVEGAR